MLDKTACLNAIAQAIRDLNYGAEVKQVRQHYWISVSWRDQEIITLRLENIFKRDTRTSVSKGQLTEVMLEIVDWKITTAVQLLPDGLVNLESLPQYFEDMREEL